MVYMARKNFIPIASLAAAGVLWGVTVPLSKLSLAWLGPAWLTVVRFAMSAPLLALVGRRTLRQALVPRVAISGAIGFGAVIMLQTAGVQRTSVSHAAVILGTVPVLVALMAAVFDRAHARPRAWGGVALAVGGIAVIAGAGGRGATAYGDLLVFASAALSAAFILVQPRLLNGRAPASVTAVQFAAGTLVTLPVAATITGAPAAPTNPTPVVTVAALSLVGTLVPFWLFAFGQSRVPAGMAGVFVNLEPLVGVAIGWLAFGDAAAPQQVAGVVAVLAGIFLSASPRSRRTSSRPAGSPRTGRHGARILGGHARAPGARSAPVHAPTRHTGGVRRVRAPAGANRPREMAPPRRHHDREAGWPRQFQCLRVPMIQRPGSGPQKRLSLASPRLSPIRK
jgi:drug/metabolite transporter (DMT)-like permease